MLTALVALLACSAPAALPELKSGDLVFHSSRSRQSAFIQRATHSPESHVGIVEVARDGTFVIEAVQPVSRTPLASWIARGAGPHLRIMRLPALDGSARERVSAEAKRFLGKPYDARFGPSDEALYCSELVEKAFERGAGVSLGTWQTLASLDLRGLEPALAQRYGGKVPRELRLITPASLAADPRLVALAVRR